MKLNTDKIFVYYNGKYNSQMPEGGDKNFTIEYTKYIMTIIKEHIDELNSIDGKGILIIMEGLRTDSEMKVYFKFDMPDTLMKKIQMRFLEKGLININ